MSSIWLGAALLLCVGIASGRNAFNDMFPKDYEQIIDTEQGVNLGPPLFLTPYLEKGEIAEARKLSIVGPLPGTKLPSNAGFLTVNKTTNNNMYFWFFPSQNKPETDPVLLWLQGGPGASSLFGLFVEQGPFFIDKDGSLFERNLTWNKKYSMLYIDNPVGAGFSFTEKDSGYATNEEDVARDLYNALIQFFSIYTMYQKNDFYVTGESYAGKYVPAISYKIHTENPGAKLKINFKGMAIGDGLCDPINMIDKYPDFLYNIGVFDEMERDFFALKVTECIDLMEQEKWLDAFKVIAMLIFDDNSFTNNVTETHDLYNLLRTQIFDALLNGDFAKGGSYFFNVTGTTDYYNFLHTKSPPNFNYYPKYVLRDDVRNSIHVGNLTYNDGMETETHLLVDFLQSVSKWVEVILDNYKVLIYNGQLDIIINLPMTEEFLSKLNWSGSEAYRNTPKFIWKINPKDEEVAGYVRQVKNFYQVVVRTSGHILPYDQPARGWDMIQRFIENRSFE